jgi:hypothetical protein
MAQQPPRHGFSRKQNLSQGRERKKTEAMIRVMPPKHWALWIAVLASSVFLLVKGLRMGYLGGDLRRNKEPIRYWTKVVLLITFCVLGLLLTMSVLTKG